MAWPDNPRPARSLVVLRDQLNKMYPGRDKSSDGMIADEAHQARTSDHNPDDKGIVKAFDITPDPDKGLNLQDLADDLVRDIRANYVIYNRHIWQNGAWSKYTGADPHTDHLHLSVKASNGDQTALWNIGESMDKATQIATIRLNHLKSLAKTFGVDPSLPEDKIVAQVATKWKTLNDVNTIRDNTLRSLARLLGLPENSPVEVIVAGVTKSKLTIDQLKENLIQVIRNS